MGLRSWRIAAACMCLGAALSVAASVQACGLDDVPSLSANGVLAQRMTSKPSRADLAHWAPFIFSGSYRHGATVQIGENVTELRRSLPAQAFGHPWRWTLGDGTTISSFNVKHSYRRAGEYRITVTAYYSAYKAWFEFDDALIRIH
ncbi:MAG TPA: PKD domain-containing protein [Chloroflexota bacterium]|nr:PKD domain-containing protein [Chloroflexota bacterium]